MCRIATFVGPKAGAEVTYTTCEGETLTSIVGLPPNDLSACVIPDSVEWIDTGAGIGTTGFFDNC